MGIVLSDADVAAYCANGYLAPVAALTAAEARAARACLEAHERAHGQMKGPWLHGSHLYLVWADRLIRHTGVLDAVERIVGPNILVYGTSFFIKEPQDVRFVSWHQDSTYWGMEPPDIVTAWLALSESVSENGAMRVIPGTHHSQLAHRETFAADNMLSRGQEIAVEVDEAQAVALELLPGEMSLHHVRLFHGSEPNPSAKRRIGFAIRYMPTHVRQIAGARDTATLVRGTDAFGNFDLLEAPVADMAPEALVRHRQAASRRAAIQSEAALRAMSA